MKLTDRSLSPSGFSTNQTYIHIVDTNNPTQDPAGSSFKSTINGAISGSPYTVMISGTGVNSTIRRNSSNIASGNNSGSLGGENNQVLTSHSMIVGGCDNTISGGTHSFIGGGCCNVASGYYGRSIVVGGKNNTSSGRDSFIGGGQYNCTGYISSSVVGGEQNCSLCRGSFVGGGSNNTVSGGCSSVVAGQSNVSSSSWSFIGGGYCNTASGQNSFIGGGCKNTASGCTSTIGGGYCNTASGCFSFIGGGCCNTVIGGNSFIGGGRSNSVCSTCSSIIGGSSNLVSGCLSFIGGGDINNVSGIASSIVGGCCNIVSGCFSSIIGGQSNNDGGFNNIHIIGSNITGTTSGTTFVNNLRSLGSVSATTISATTYQNLNNQISLSGLSGVSITSVSNGDMLVYSGLSWTNKTQEFISRQNQRVVYTDFMSSSTSAGVQFPYAITLVNTGAVNSSILTNGVNPGINRFRSSATPNSGVYLIPIGTVIGTGTYYYQPNTQVDYIFRTPATIVGTGIIVRFGMTQTSSSTADFEYGTYIEINENSLYGKTADNSVRSQTSTTYTLSTDTWYHGRVKYVSSSLIEYSLYNMNGVLLWSDTLTTNIPSSTRINPIILALSSGSAAIDLIVNDYFSITYPVSNRGALN